MSDLLKYYRLEDDLGVDYYREGKEEGELEWLVDGAWYPSCLNMEDMRIMTEKNPSFHFDVVSSREVPE